MYYTQIISLLEKINIKLHLYSKNVESHNICKAQEKLYLAHASQYNYVQNRKFGLSVSQPVAFGPNW